MDCHDCEMRAICAPVPGMPGQCAVPVECEQCIGDRMDVVEAESAKLDADIAAMRKELDDLVIQIRAQGREIARQTREIRAISKATKEAMVRSAETIARAELNAKKTIDLESLVESLKKIVESIKKAPVF